MKPANLALVSLLALGLTTVGCAAKTDEDPEPLGTATDELIGDNEEADEVESSVEGGIEESLSGATPTDPGSPADGATETDLMAKVKSNPGLFFKPAGCITTTIAANVATHVFKDCTGPYGLVGFNGTVTSTYAKTAGSLTITHQATDFKINNATITGSRTVVYTLSGGVISKTRTGSWTGTTGKGKPITHNASWTATYDIAAKCVTRDGSATTSVGGREHSVTIDNYKRCGIGSLGCPESGTVVLQRTKAGESLSVTIEFLGGRQYRVTGPNGRTATRGLICRAS
jgi:hypothetical protein